MRTHDFILFGKTKLVFVRRELGDIWRYRMKHGYPELKKQALAHEHKCPVPELRKELRQYQLRCPWSGIQCFCSKLYPNLGFPWKVNNGIPNRCQTHLSK